MDGTGIFDDLLNVEVNTIIKRGITAHKMPSLPFALLDIISDYADELRRLGVDLEPYFRPTSADLWLGIREDPDYLKLAEHAYARANGRPAAADEQAELYNYVKDLWPVLDRARRTAAVDADWRFSMTPVSNGWDSFERLRIAAHEAGDTGNYEGADRLMLARIVGNCARLKFVVQGLQRTGAAQRRGLIRRSREGVGWSELIPKTRDELLHGELRDRAVPLDTLLPEHRAMIRKIWEVGVERVVVQTSVQVDGDVVTRIADDLIEGYSEAVRALVLQAHRDSLDTSIGHWRTLIDVAIKLFADLLRVRIR